ncbi:hypothetical protein ACFQ1M_17810 [Sungkyunkwania multivorans]|uniref:Uncharacterized protein n=1 Tax=Sungkyunkwania multivorans TaxID=1173618 RepID=A0ABW3D4U2_9FLAO
MILRSLLCYILCAASFAIGFSQEDLKEWTGLKDAAHDIGFCVFHLDMPFCDAHIEELERRQEEAGEDTDVYYFLMKEKWASKRIIDWAQRFEHDGKDGLLLFDIRQNRSPKNSKHYEKSSNNFMLFSLKDSIQFAPARRLSEDKVIVTVLAEKDATILENVLWREFMSGRLGLLSKKILLPIATDEEAHVKYAAFVDALRTFKKAVANDFVQDKN